jgi:hypothetical protein
MWPCGYGSDPRCMTVATCASPDGIHNLAWYVEAPDPSCNGNPVECPAAFDAGAGGACPVQGTCTYPEGRCACGLCNMGGVCTDMCGPDIDAGPSIDGGYGPTGPSARDWACETWPPVAPGCPDPLPFLGTPCSAEGQTCGQFPCFCDPVDVGPGMQCTGGYWGFINGGC